MWGTSYENIIEEQYWLSRRGHISISDSNEMAEFERSFFVSLVHSDISAERKAYENAGKDTGK